MRHTWGLFGFFHLFLKATISHMSKQSSTRLYTAIDAQISALTSVSRSGISGMAVWIPSFSLWRDQNRKPFSVWISSYWLTKSYPYFLYVLEDHLHSYALRMKYSFSTCETKHFLGWAAHRENIPEPVTFLFFASSSFGWLSCLCWLPCQTMSNGCSSEENNYFEPSSQKSVA